MLLLLCRRGAQPAGTPAGIQAGLSLASARLQLATPLLHGLRRPPVGIGAAQQQALFDNTARAIGPARAAMFIHLMPAFGALLSVAFLGEAFYLYHALGIAGILAGVGLSTRGR